ncbi:MAG TPA: helix-turn-helix transcriptional regulator [Saprospiraceae bacterium]|jgi:DNA-binding Xre family transcriptional regulator|nr:helix-turn-helix transcriptional regulator [Saprospiraceae bacterium]HMT71901.1 helix-turn-helix transcriptional regulator [Saprospiraceae bacterium]
MLKLNLAPIFAARGIKYPYTFLVKSGFTYHTATNLLNSKTRSFRLDHIEDLCRILVCEPNDLLEWSPELDVHYAAKNPLEKLRVSNTELSLTETLASMPLSDLKKATKDFLDNSMREQSD